MDKVGEDGAVEIMGNEEEPSGHGIGRTEVSLWAFTKAFEPLNNQAESVAASATLARFLRCHTKFKATCDSSRVKTAWSSYAALEALLSPSPPFQNSFCLTVKTCIMSAEEATLKATVWFFWEAMKQWHRAGKRPGTMLLRRLELPYVNVAASCLYPNKLKSLLEGMHGVPGLPASPEEILAITNKLRRMIACSEHWVLDHPGLKEALESAGLMNFE